MSIRAACTALMLLADVGAAAAQPATTFASPMVDRTIYREGAVQRWTKHFGHWSIVCDDITTLKQRFCSLRSVAASGDQGRTVSIDVSTGDDGRPAALLHLPVAISLAYGLQATADGSTTTRVSKTARTARADDKRNIGVATCSQKECLALWSLSRPEIQALNEGRGITLTICTAGSGKLEFARDLRTGSCGAKIVYSLMSQGFKEAVAASTN